MRTRGFGATVAVAVVLGGFAVAGCARSTPPVQAVASDVIKIGGLWPVTGPRASVGQRNTAGAGLAVKEANDLGGVLGRRVELVVGDDACDARTAVNAAREIIAKGIVASVGGACSAATVPTTKLFHEAGVPMVIPTSNSTELIAPGYNSVFLVSGTTAEEARVALAHMRRLGLRRLAVVDDKTSYSATMATAAADLAKRPDSGVTLTGHQQLSQGATSHRRVADEVIQGGADTVFFTGYSAEAGQLIHDLKLAGYAGTIFLGDGCIDLSTFAKLTPAQSDGVYGIAMPHPQWQTGIAEWVPRYDRHVGSPPGPSSMQAYDAVMIVLDAIRRAGSTERAAVRAAIAATADYQGLTGPVRFNPDGTRTDAPFLLLQAKDNRYVLAQTG